MDIEIVCKGCQQTIDVDAGATGQEFNCPSCGLAQKVPGVPEFPECPYAPLFGPPTNFTAIELECAPSAEVKHLDPNWRDHGFSSIRCYQPVYSCKRKVIMLKVREMRETKYWREGDTCYTAYDVPTNVICHYYRYLGTRSRVSEYAYFYMLNGSMQLLTTPAKKLPDFVSTFMPQFSGFKFSRA